MVNSLDVRTFVSYGAAMTNPTMPSELDVAAWRIVEAVRERDELIVSCHAAGMSYRSIAADVHLSHTRVGQIIAEQTAG